MIEGMEDGGGSRGGDLPKSAPVTARAWQGLRRYAFAVLVLAHVLMIFATLRSPSLRALLLASAILTLPILVLTWLLRRLRIHSERVALLASLVVIYIVYYSNAQDVSLLVVAPFRLTRWFFPVYTLCIGTLGYLVLRRRQMPAPIASLPALIAVGLLAQALYEAGPNLLKSLEPALSQTSSLAVAGVVSPQPVAPAPGPERLRLPVRQGRYPDIYYIILDSYTSAPSLQRYWGYNNTPFIDSLRALGFYVADSSRSSGTSTAICLASYLNEGVLDNSRSFREQIRESKIVARLEREGYDICNLSIFDLNGHPRAYNVPYFEEGDASDYSYLLRQDGLIRLFLLKFTADSSARQLALIDSTAHLAAEYSPRPRFVYLHLLMPHPPFFLDSLGRIVPSAERLDGADPLGYLTEVKGTNIVILKLLSTIVHVQKDNLPVIIVQGDHGSRLLKGSDGAAESYTILNAYFNAGRGRRGLSSTISPTASFDSVLLE